MKQVDKVTVRFFRSYGIYKVGEIAGFRPAVADILTQGVGEDQLCDLDPKVWPVAVLVKKPSTVTK